MNSHRCLASFLLLSASFCFAKDKPVVCVSAEAKQDTLASSLTGFEKTAIKQVNASKKFAGAADNNDRCDYRLLLTINEERPYEVGVVGRTSNDPLLRDQSEKPYIRFDVAYELQRDGSNVNKGLTFRREEAYPDPNARLSAIEAAVDESLKKLQKNP